MTESLIRRLIFSKASLKGYYRFGDVFQLTPAPESWPRPPHLNGDYPLILELRYDPQIAPGRESDFWHRDVWERVCDKELGTEGWSNDQITMRLSQAKMWRPGAITKELTVLLSALTNHRFFEYESLQSWTNLSFDPGATTKEGNPVHSTWASTGYRMPNLDWLDGEFNSDSRIDDVPRGPYQEHYRNSPDTLVVGQVDDYQVRFRDALDDLLSIYFGLEGDKKHAFYAACHLWAQALDLSKIRAPSMALVASVSAIETLVNFMDIPAPSCRECGAPPSIEKCPDCGAPRYRLANRFRAFLKDFAGAGSQFSNKLYKYRSKISHAGDLLRDELFDSGFTKGGDDEQMIFQIETTKVTHTALVNWLIAQAER